MAYCSRTILDALPSQYRWVSIGEICGRLPKESRPYERIMEIKELLEKMASEGLVNIRRADSKNWFSTDLYQKSELGKFL